MEIFTSCPFQAAMPEFNYMDVMLCAYWGVLGLHVASLPLHYTDAMNAARFSGSTSTGTADVLAACAEGWTFSKLSLRGTKLLRFLATNSWSLSVVSFSTYCKETQASNANWKLLRVCFGAQGDKAAEGCDWSISRLRESTLLLLSTSQCVEYVLKQVSHLKPQIITIVRSSCQKH